MRAACNVIRPTGPHWTGHDVNTASGAQYFVHIFFDGHVARNGRDVVSHQVRRANVREGVAHGHLQEAFLRRAQQEPSDKSGPQAADPVSIQRLPHAENDHHVGENLSCRRCYFRRAREIAGNSPGNAAKDAATVKRKPRDKIEDGQNEIDFPQPDSRGVNHIVPVKIARNQPETAGEKYARKRTGDGDVEFLLGVVGLARDSRQSRRRQKA